MKMNFKSICMACLAGTLAVLASSCKKQDTDTASFTLVLPEMAQESPEGEKAYIDFNANNVFKWNANDAVMAYNLAQDNSNLVSVKGVFTTGESAEGQQRANFSGTSLGDMLDYYFYFYPSKRAVGTLDVDNRETFIVDAVQDYTTTSAGNVTVAKDALSMACSVSAPTSSVNMKHIFGICRLRLKGDSSKTVEEVRVVDNAFNLHGSVSMKLHEVDPDQFTGFINNFNPDNATYMEGLNTYLQTLGYESTPSANDPKILTLNCSGKNITLNENTQTVFYMVVRPGAFAKGFKIQVKYVGDDTYYETTQYANGNLAYRMKPGIITTFSPTAVLK